MADTSDPPEPKDEFFEAQVERALRRYRGWLSPTQLTALEATVRDTFENDPVAAALLQAGRPRKTLPNTGEADTPGAAPEPRKDPADGER
jgi:hypothetical protein